MKTPDREPVSTKKAWTRPALVVHGDARVLTESQTKGGDSAGRGPLLGGGPAHS